MPAMRNCSRTDTFELKVQLERKLGSQKAEKYFNLLTRYLSLEVGKSEFDKLCIRLIGRENVRLHNALIKGIVKNAIVSKSPPHQVKSDGLLTSKVPNGTHPRSGLQSLCRDVFPPSPRKGRTPNIRERRLKDRPSPLGANEKIQEQQSATELLSLGSKPPVEVNSVEDGEEVEQDALTPGTYSRSPVTAPLGISLHSKEPRKVLCSGSASSYSTETCHYSGLLPPTNSLEKRLKQKLNEQGLDITMDCVNLLNNGLDSFLKCIIKPSLELAGARSLQTPGRLFSTTMLDFRVAAETNPKMLGENWPIQLDKIRLFDFDL